MKEFSNNKLVTTQIYYKFEYENIRAIKILEGLYVFILLILNNPD